MEFIDIFSFILTYMLGLLSPGGAKADVGGEVETKTFI